MLTSAKVRFPPSTSMSSGKCCVTTEWLLWLNAACAVLHCRQAGCRPSRRSRAHRRLRPMADDRLLLEAALRLLQSDRSYCAPAILADVSRDWDQADVCGCGNRFPGEAVAPSEKTTANVCFIRVQTGAFVLGVTSSTTSSPGCHGVSTELRARIALRPMVEGYCYTSAQPR